MVISRIFVLLSILLHLSLVASQNNCYWRANNKASSNVIPCRLPGEESQHASCCQLGDICLSNNACWNPSYNETYIYGCTDPSYSDPSCPWKCGPDFANVPWTGLNICYDANNTWICRHPTTNSALIAPVIGECTTDSIVAFEGPDYLIPYAYLPESVGGSTTFFSQVGPSSFEVVPGSTVTQRTSPTMYMPTTVQYFTQSSLNQGEYTTNLFPDQTKQASSAAESSNIQSLRKMRGEDKVGPSTIVAITTGSIGVGLIILSTIIFVRKFNTRESERRSWRSYDGKPDRQENEHLMYTTKNQQTPEPAKLTVASHTARESDDHDSIDN